MIKTYGLTHIALAVEDIGRSIDFYKKVFGAQEMYNSDGFAQVQTPGSHDIIVFEEKSKKGKTTGGIQHFGFRLREIGDIKAMVSLIERSGGTIKEQGEFVPGEPYIFFYDPDGYEIEVWYEQLPAGKSFL
jgi:catechol 2,3-dioxygenase-like lactoylglutathione lyase family enzyme